MMLRFPVHWVPIRNDWPADPVLCIGSCLLSSSQGSCGYETMDMLI